MERRQVRREDNGGVVWETEVRPTLEMGLEMGVGGQRWE